MEVDSIEDFIKLIRNCKQEDEPIIRSKEIGSTIERKKECTVRAIKIVEFSIDGKLKPEVFIRCLSFINKDYYQDIVEERSISKLCGYALCGKKIPEMPKKQFFISTKSNKVYDISERKHFCSNFCYKASLHLKAQIDNTPLWLRQYEQLPNFKILNQSAGGLPGEDLTGAATLTKPPIFTPVASFTTASLSDMIEREIQKPKKKTTILKNTMQTINENNDEQEQEISESNNLTSKHKLASKNCHHKAVVKQCPKLLPVIEVEESEEKIIEPKRKIKEKKKVNIESMLIKSLNEWFTIETYIIIYGEDKVRKILSERKLSNYFESLKITELELSQQQKYMEICKRLHLQEMADEKFDGAIIGNNLKPLPDFRRIQKEGKDLQLKVKSFYNGVLFEEQNTNFGQTQKVNEDDNEERATVVPLIDSNSQHAMRKKIFLNSISKVMQQLLQTLRVTSYSSVLSDLQALVKTFKLRADNIVFKPVIWNYISVILLYILSLQNIILQKALQDNQAYIDLLFSSFPKNFIDNLPVQISAFYHSALID